MWEQQFVAPLSSPLDTVGHILCRQSLVANLLWVSKGDVSTPALPQENFVRITRGVL